MTKKCEEILSGPGLENNNNGMPEEPNDDDCCHNGCSPCVFDVYQKELKKWHSGQSSKYKRNDLLSKTRFNEFRLVEIKILGQKIKKLKFEACLDKKDLDIGGVLPYEPGEHLILRCYFDEVSGLANLFPGTLSTLRPLSRAYSLVWEPHLSDKCQFEIVVKFYKNGVASRCLNKMQIGDIAHWRGPYGGYSYRSNAHKYILALCMGTGVVPVYSLARQIICDEEDFTTIKLLFGIRHMDEIVLRDELCELTSYWNFKFVYYMTGNDTHSGKRYCETLKNGRITAETLALEIEPRQLDNTLILICGSKDFSTDMVQYIRQYDVPVKNIHVF